MAEVPTGSEELCDHLSFAGDCTRGPFEVQSGTVSDSREKTGEGESGGLGAGGHESESGVPGAGQLPCPDGAGELSGPWRARW